MPAVDIARVIDTVERSLTDAGFAVRSGATVASSKRMATGARWRKHRTAARIRA